MYMADKWITQVTKQPPRDLRGEDKGPGGDI